MKINNNKILILLFLVLLLPLATCLTMTNLTNAVVPSYGGITKMASEIFVEDFTNDTYMDAGETDAWGWGTGTITNARDFSLALLDHYPTADPVVDVDVQGRKAYIALYNNAPGSDQISVLDINDPADITLLGSSTDHERTTTLAVDGDVLYAGHYSVVQDSIFTYDVSDPYNPSWKVGWGLDNKVTDIDPEGHLVYYTAYNATNNRSLRILYAEDLFGHYIKCNWDSKNALGLDVEGHIAYVAASTEGFYILNVSDKYTPIEYGYVDTPGNATDVLVDGRFAYVVDGPAGVHIIDILDPTNPTIIGTYDTPGNAHRLAKQGNTLFVADGNGGLQVLDVADPHNPSFVADMVLPYTWDIDLYGSDLVVATDAGIYTYSIGSMADFSSSWYPNPFDQFQVWDVRVKDGIAFIAGGTDEFYIVNVRNPLQPVLLFKSSLGGGQNFMKLDVNEQFAFLVDIFGLYIFDITDLSDVKFVSYAFGIGLTDACIRGEYLYVSHTSGFAMLNVSNAYLPVWDNVHYLGLTNVTSLWVQGPTLYIVEYLAAMGAGIHVYDLSTFTAPVLLGSDTLSSYFYDIYVDGDVAQTADGRWVLPYNVSDPTAIFYTSYVHNFTYDRKGCWAFGRYSMSAEYHLGVSLVDETNLSAIEIMSNYPDANNSIQVTTYGDYTYVANKSSLVILRHFNSLGDTYVGGTTTAQSLKVNVDGLVTEATLNVDDFVPPGTSVEYFMSADGGAHWELVTPGVALTFADSGQDLLWRANITGPSDRSVHIYSVSIDYTINYAPTIPTLTALDAEKFTGIFKVEWSASNDTDDNVDHYELQISDSNTFGTILKNMTAQGTSKSVFGLGKGTFFFRVRAVDNYGVVSDWSNVESTTVKLATLWIGLIIGGGLLVIVVLIVVISLVVRRKKRTPTR
ncbi:MAG: hypothetical protein HZR80_01290 [Candidatus Heimdallarchaeota archaeon]